MAVHTASERAVSGERRQKAVAAGAPAADVRVAVDGKLFSAGGVRFPFRGVTYGTFAARSDGALFPETSELRADLEAMARAGFTIVRTYTPPPPDMLDAAAETRLRILAGLDYRDWRYLIGNRSNDARFVRSEAMECARAFAQSAAGNPAVFGVCVGNEVPADVVRWVGTKSIRNLLREMSAVIHDIDPGQLVTYANYPTAEYLHSDDSDFVTFNVFLETRPEFQRYITKLQHAAGGRPLVLGEIGLDAGADARGEARQAEVLSWQLEVALECGVSGTCVFSWTDSWAVGGQPVEGWHFGLTRRDRSPRPALRITKRWNRRETRDLRPEWPSMSVVICAHNAESTLDECLTHTCALDYPELEVVVVDDGSTDSTAQIARRHESVRLVSIPHSGLGTARNEGFKAAGGELIAFLDSDAYPSPEWPYHLALGFDRDDVVGVGGPNECPPDAGPREQQVAAAPGGPIHVLLSDDRAEHIPGCNMAFTRAALEHLGGFDPIYTVAGDDVDFCWRVLDRDWEIAFQPAALVWHRPRAAIMGYLRQQWGYGRSEAVVQARHPDRFSMLGSARWRGRIYSAAPRRAWRERIYRGLYGAAPYQSVYRGGGDLGEIAHQLGVPIAAAGLLLTPLVFVAQPLVIAPILALVFLAGLAAFDFEQVRVPANARSSPFKFRATVTLLSVLQAIARAWGRARNRSLARRKAIAVRALAGPVESVGSGVFVIPDARPRPEVAENVVQLLRKAGMRVVPPTGWEPYDALLLGSAMVGGRLLTSAHPHGSIQLRVQRFIRWKAALAAATVTVAAALTDPRLALAFAVLVAGNVALGWWRTGYGLRRAILGGPE
jgi:glycosyltransferase involved in cell wall biosynthesis